MTDTPGRDGSTHPPRWYLRAVITAVGAVMLAILLWHAVSSMTQVLFMLLGSFFIALAMEPPVNWIAKRSLFGRPVRRGLATGMVMLGGIVVILAVIALFGGLFVSQATQLIDAIPDWYHKIVTVLQQDLGIQLPDSLDSLNFDSVKQLLDDYGSELASGVIAVGGAIFSFILALLGMLLIVFYTVAQGPKLRQTICRPFPPQRQAEVLTLWRVSQDKISGYINSRLALAAISSVCTGIFLTIMQIPYSVPLAVFVGLVSQFIPTVGTYIAGAAPVMVALAISPLRALIVLAFIIAYQQVENFVFAPKISARTMDINPAVAFVAVLAFGAIMGPIGAFLSLPLAATFQALLSTYVQRYDLIDSVLLDDEPDEAAAKKAVAHTGHGGHGVHDGGTTGDDGGTAGDKPAPGDPPTR